MKGFTKVLFAAALFAGEFRRCGADIPGHTSDFISPLASPPVSPLFWYEIVLFALSELELISPRVAFRSPRQRSKNRRRLCRLEWLHRHHD
jgi:hypothetical protein